MTRTSPRTTRRSAVLRRLIPILVILLGALLIGAGPSSASPSIPGVPDCKDAPAPQRPGDGLSGFLDPSPEKPVPPGDPFAASPTTSIYDQYGYAGLTWHTYDLGCAGSLGDPGATADNMIGNLALSGATWGIALANGVHNRVAHPQTYMAPLDSVVANVSDRIKTAIWGPWGGVALLGVVVLLLWYSSSGRLSSVTRAAAWSILVLTVLAGVTQYPTRISGFFDDAVTTTISQVNAGTAGLTNLSSASDPAHAQGSLLVDRVLYEAWVRGELGSSTSAAAKKWGPALFRESAFSYDEARQAQDPKRAQELTDRKANDFKATADEIQQQDPTAYLALQGKTNSRGGVGFMSLAAMLFTTLFRLVADIFMFTGLVMLRFLVMFFPAVAVLGVMAPMSSIVRRVANMAGASVVNVVSFAAGSAVHTTVISALLAQSDSAGMGLLALVLCLVTTVVAFILLFPLLSLTNIVGLSSGQRGVHALKKAGRMVTRYAVTRKAVGDGEEDAQEEQGETSTSEPSTGSASGSRRRRSRIGLGTPETFGRPEPASVGVPLAISASGVSMSGSRLNAGHTSAASESEPAARRSDGASAREPIYLSSRSALPAGTSTALAERETTKQPSPSDLRASRPSMPETTPSPSTRPGVATLEGVIVGPSEGPPAPTTHVHDSQTQIRSDGIGPRLFDPATKTEVPVDIDGNIIARNDEP